MSAAANGVSVKGCPRRPPSESARVAPINTDQREPILATSAAVPICVASPVSAMKTRMNALANALRRAPRFGSSLSSSPLVKSSQSPKPRKSASAVQRTTCGSSVAKSDPSATATKPCTRKAAQDPKNTGRGLLREASSNTV